LGGDCGGWAAGRSLPAQFSDLPNGIPAHDTFGAWASANHVGLGQVAVEAKSTEITANPTLVQVLAVSGCIVTIDAKGCQ
jgi:hypothetical protein